VLQGIPPRCTSKACLRRDPMSKQSRPTWSAPYLPLRISNFYTLTLKRDGRAHANPRCGFCPDGTIGFLGPERFPPLTCGGDTLARLVAFGCCCGPVRCTARSIPTDHTRPPAEPESGQQADTKPVSARQHCAEKRLRRRSMLAF